MIPYINNKKKPFFAKSGPKAGRALRKDRPAVYNKSNLCGPRQDAKKRRTKKLHKHQHKKGVGYLCFGI